jgi:glycosyltransferase involved in cell wall biosynthesis
VLRQSTNNPKRILLVIPRPTRGGATQVLLNLLHEDIARTKFRFYTLYNDSSVQKDSLSQVVERSFASPLDKPSRMRNLLIKFSPSLYSILKKWHLSWVCYNLEPDIIYINTVSQTPHAQQALKMGVPLVLHAHEMDFLVTQKMNEKWVSELVIKVPTWIVCAQAVGEFYQTVYKLPSEKQKLLHGPASVARLTSTHPGKYKKAINCSFESILIGVCASFTYLKGADIFIKAIQLVKKSYKEQICFAWLGLDENVKDLVFYNSMISLVQQYGLEQDFYIFSNTTEVGDFYTDIDVLVHPSRTEAFPLSILEAMLFAKPVVAMDVGGIREVVDETTGYLVKDRTPEGLAEGILYLVSSEDSRRQAGQKGRQRVLEKFEAGVQAPKWLNLLENL